jgi:hypothetical protein
MASRYSNGDEALKAVEADFQYWSGKLTESSFQLCIGIVAANWAVYHTVDNLRAEPCAVWSIGLVVIALGLSLVVAKRMSEAHREQCEFAEKNKTDWDNACKSSHTPPEWPFTAEIENIGWVARELKTWLPVLAGVLFLISLFPQQ